VCVYDVAWRVLAAGAAPPPASSLYSDDWSAVDMKTLGIMPDIVLPIFQANEVISTALHPMLHLPI
jgi:hypothetical protein